MLEWQTWYEKIWNISIRIKLSILSTLAYLLWPISSFTVQAKYFIPFHFSTFQHFLPHCYFKLITLLLLSLKSSIAQDYHIYLLCLCPVTLFYITGEDLPMFLTTAKLSIFLLDSISFSLSKHCSSNDPLYFLHYIYFFLLLWPLQSE